MAGLLDFLNSAEAQTGLGLLAAAGPRSDGAGFGQRMLEGLNQGDRWKAQQAAQKRAAMQDEMQQMQMAQAQAQMAQQQKMQGLAQQFAKPEGFDYGGYANAMAGVDPMRAMEIQKSLAKQGPEYSTAPQYDQAGRAFILAKDGTMKYLDGVKARDKLEAERLGDKVVFRNPYSTEALGSMAIGQSADSKAGNAVTMRGQNMSDSRAREANFIQQQAGRTQIMQTPEGLIAIDKGTNQAAPVTLGGAPVRSEDSMKKTANAKTVISLLDEADKLLPNSTGSLVGTGVDMGLGAVGVATKGAKSVAQLKAIEGQLIASMPRMEGPQSDSDRLLYQKAAGDLANPMAPVATRQAASGTIRKLQERYTGQATNNIQSLLDKYK